jgi:hypothetical protein
MRARAAISGGATVAVAVLVAACGGAGDGDTSLPQSGEQVDSQEYLAASVRSW